MSVRAPLLDVAGAPAVAVALPRPISKEWRTAQAQALLAGYAAELGEDDAGRPELIVTRWAMTRAFSDLVEFEHWLLRARGPLSERTSVDSPVTAMPGSQYGKCPPEAPTP